MSKISNKQEGPAKGNASSVRIWHCCQCGMALLLLPKENACINCHHSRCVYCMTKSPPKRSEEMSPNMVDMKELSRNMSTSGSAMCRERNSSSSTQSLYQEPSKTSSAASPRSGASPESAKPREKDSLSATKLSSHRTSTTLSAPAPRPGAFPESAKPQKRDSILATKSSSQHTSTTLSAPTPRTVSTPDIAKQWEKEYMSATALTQSLHQNATMSSTATTSSSTLVEVNSEGTDTARASDKDSSAFQPWHVTAGIEGIGTIAASSVGTTYFASQIARDTKRTADATFDSRSHQSQDSRSKTRRSRHSRHSSATSTSYSRGKIGGDARAQFGNTYNSHYQDAALISSTRPSPSTIVPLRSGTLGPTSGEGEAVKNYEETPESRATEQSENDTRSKYNDAMELYRPWRGNATVLILLLLILASVSWLRRNDNAFA